MRQKAGRIVSLKGFAKAGHPPTLVSAFLYFDVSFMIWVMLGPLGPFLGESLKLTAGQKGLLTALPLLGGSFFRLILGPMTERIGGRKTALIGLTLTFLPLLIGWRFATTFEEFLGVGILLGVAGASFAAALPLASAWYPPEYQGIAMGIAGAGNSGTLFASLFAPRLAKMFGWHEVFLFAMIPVLLVWILFFVLAKDAPRKAPPKGLSDYKEVLKIGDTGWFCFLYSLTFGGFSGLVSFLTIFFFDQYHLTKVQAGDLTTLVVVFGSFLRPVGGLLSDRIGGYRMLLVLLAGAAISLGCVATLPSVTVAVAFLVLTMGMLGMGNGAVFQLVPQRFPERVGLITGLVGAAGGIGGFLLPNVLGGLKGITGSFGPGLGICALAIGTGAAALFLLGPVWRRTWQQDSAWRAGLLPATTSQLQTASLQVGQFSER